ncbi:MAG: S-layer homology domain-containing protein, partial [Clostridiales bacterium]|nr:S-layer homology domain-containing protein [Clostridiales bacterium]
MVKRLLGAVLSVVFFVSGAGVSGNASGVEYTDISGHRAENIIKKWTSYNIFCGYLAGPGEQEFRPDAKLTQAEMLEVINRIMRYDSPIVEASLQDDIFRKITGKWYERAVGGAISAGIINIENFESDDGVTRLEADRLFRELLGFERLPVESDFFNE